MALLPVGRLATVSALLALLLPSPAASQQASDAVPILPWGTLDTTFSTHVPSGTYFVRVRAANAFGHSAPSNEVTIVVP
jgi:hypothetical protein